MISSIQGKVIHKDLNSLIVLVGGIGVDIVATRSCVESAMLDEQVFVYTRLVVREDSLTLYGFSNDSERTIFDTLLKISGVGPRLAVMILSNLSIDNLKNAVATEKPELLTRVPGIGRKTAQKILLELKDKIPVGLDAMPADSFDDVNSDLMDALLSLGFSVVEAQTAIQALPHDAPKDTEARLILALQYLNK